MHSEGLTPNATPENGGPPWYKELNRYHWFVLIVAALGWLFDTFDQQLFNLARGPAMAELREGVNPQVYGGLATMIFMLGWATGGIIFGILGDRWGRAKTMVLTILLYSLFTGLSALSVTFWDFAFYRFLTGLGVGGEFAVGVALVAEVMPNRARPHALGWLQASSAFGNIGAAFVSMGLAPLQTAGMLGTYQPWRWMFVIGALPAFLALLIRRNLKEPERWSQLRASGTVKLGSIRELFGHPTWRRNAIVGLMLATAGVVGLWGIGFFSFDLVRSVFRNTFEAELRASEAAQDQQFVRLVIHHPQRLAEVLENVKPGNPDKFVKPDNHLLDPVQRERPDSRLLYQTAAKLQSDNQPVSPGAVLDAIDAAGQASLARRSQRTVFEWLTDLVLGQPDIPVQTPEDRQRREEYLGSPVPDADPTPHLQRLTPRIKKLEGDLTMWAGINGLLLNIGAFFGIYSFSRITHYVGRKPAFAVAFIMALLSTAFAFWFLKQFSDVFWMVPIMGFFQISLFGGYAIYFPELFPTRLRSTGTSFCYNVGRFLSAPGPLLLGTLASMVYGSYGLEMSWRLAGVTMCAFFLLGLAVLPFAPETKGKPLPE